MYRTLALGLALLPHCAAAQEPVTLEVLESEEYGRFLAVGDRPVYLFSTDTRGIQPEPPTVTCIEECQDAWPPVVGPVTAGEGVAPDLLGAVEADGRMIATYDGWPLYQFERDAEGGPPTGQEFEGFGGSWLLLDPQGEPIRGEGV